MRSSAVPVDPNILDRTLFAYVDQRLELTRVAIPLLTLPHQFFVLIFERGSAARAFGRLRIAVRSRFYCPKLRQDRRIIRCLLLCIFKSFFRFPCLLVPLFPDAGKDLLRNDWVSVTVVRRKESEPVYVQDGHSVSLLRCSKAPLDSFPGQMWIALTAADYIVCTRDLKI
jgi:hypothetical protein